MTETRYQELLGQLLDGSLSLADAEALCRALENDPERLRNVREHLMLSELMAQAHAPHRSPEALWQGIQARIHAESESKGGLTQEPTQPGRARTRAPRWKSWRLAVGLAAGLLISIAGAIQWATTLRPLPAETDHPGSNMAVVRRVSLEGKAVCAHCTLHQTKDCQPVVRIRQGEGQAEQTLFLSDNAISRDFKRRQGCCRTPLLVHAEGTVRSERGRLLLGATRLEIQR